MPATLKSSAVSKNNCNLKKDMGLEKNPQHVQQILFYKITECGWELARFISLIHTQTCFKLWRYHCMPKIIKVVILLKKKCVTWPALGSGKVWILVPDWFKLLEPNAGHMTLKIGPLYFNSAL